MALFLDSADLDHARQAASYGFVRGATTNPILLARAGHRDPREAMTMLCSLLGGPVFYQLTTYTLEEMRSEADEFLELAPNLGLKIPCTLVGLQFAVEVVGRTSVAVTGVFNPGQAYLAGLAGAHYVIPYVNRLSRYVGDGPAVVASMAEVLLDTDCEVLAAGIKSAKEAVDTLLAGADHLSLPLEVIQAMASNALTDQAIADFDAAARGKRGASRE